MQSIFKPAIWFRPANVPFLIFPLAFPRAAIFLQSTLETVSSGDVGAAAAVDRRSQRRRRQAGTRSDGEKPSEQKRKDGGEQLHGALGFD